MSMRADHLAVFRSLNQAGRKSLLNHIMSGNVPVKSVPAINDPTSIMVLDVIAEPFFLTEAFTSDFS